MKRYLATLALVAAANFNPASAANIAIFGNNSIASFLASNLANNVTVVTDGQLSTAGFLNSFDLFIYTRDDDSFGTSLSAPAAANVQAFVTGNIVLFTSDLQDNGFPAGDPTVTLMNNAVNFASNKGFIGEFTGACAAMTTTPVGLTALGLIAGECVGLTIGPGSDPMTIVQTGHPVVLGVASSLTLGDSHQFFAELTGVDSNLIIARNTIDGEPGIPSIVASQVQRVPEPASLSLLGLASLALFLSARRRRVVRG